jgi:hypothetical protein
MQIQPLANQQLNIGPSQMLEWQGGAVVSSQPSLLSMYTFKSKLFDLGLTWLGSIRIGAKLKIF